jgi:hypothetical protein
LADKLPVTVKLPNVPNTVEFTCVVIVVLCYSVFTVYIALWYRHHWFAKQ